MRFHHQQRIYLSPPHIGRHELHFVHEAFATNWVAPAGPHLLAFESELAAVLGVRHVVALSSGTAAIHLALRHLNLKPQDEVFCSTLTFAGSANPIVYERARPVFIDCDRSSWNMDPDLLAEELRRCNSRCRLPRAVICVNLYGQCADWAAIRKICRRYGIPLIEDAAEALGATYRGRPAGSFGWANILSFNGNKIITTSGGGALATNDRSLAMAARFLSQQARDPAPHYQHSQIGFNYRLSNVLAGIGRGQLRVLARRVAARRRNYRLYTKYLKDAPGICFMPEAFYGRCTRWLTCILVSPDIFGATRENIRRALEVANIEARPVWKPMHLQPAFQGCRIVGGMVSEEIFAKGLCLPSGSNLSEGDIRRISETILSTPRKGTS